MEAVLTKINAIENPKQTLENMRIGSTVIAPHFQRSSLETTKFRIMNECAKRYTFNKKDKDGKSNDSYFFIKRIR